MDRGHVLTGREQLVVSNLHSKKHQELMKEPQGLQLYLQGQMGSRYKHVPISIQKAVSALKKGLSSMNIIKFENFRYWC